MKCEGRYDCCGARCVECCRFMDDCEGNPDFGDYNGEWLPIDEVEDLVTGDLAADEYRRGKE